MRGLALGAAGFGAGVALAALGARRPVIRRWPLSAAQAASCLPASEAPGPVSAAVTAAGVAGLLAGGPVAGPLAAGTGALALAALADLRGDADRSRRVFDAALAGLPHLPGPPPERLRPWEISALPTRYRAAHLRADGASYGPDPAHRLDVWAPRDLPAGAGAPVLVQVHGGGWTSGTRRLAAAPLLSHLVGQGWVCVTIDYRHAPGVRLPGIVTDVKRALAWVRATIAEHGGDPGFIALTGGSAGGHLVSLAGLTASDPAFQAGFADADTSVAAVVPVYGVHDLVADEHGLRDLMERTVIGTGYAADRGNWEALSPVHRIAGADRIPPYLVVHGDTDAIVAVEQSRRFAAGLRDAGADVRYAELPRAQHGYDTWPTARTAHHVRAVHRFLAAVHARYAATELVSRSSA